LFEFPELPEPPELPPPPPLEDIAAESAFFKALASISVDLQGLALNASTSFSCTMVCFAEARALYLS